MNLFEKITNYELLARLDEADVFVTTAAERSWLKTMLADPASQLVLSDENRERLQAILDEDEALELQGSLTEKARSREGQVGHPLLPELRDLIRRRCNVCFVPAGKSGRPRQPSEGIPYKLEYSMVKREWYLLWYNSGLRRLQITRLDKISQLRGAPCTAEEWTLAQEQIRRSHELQQDTAVLEVPSQYNRELSRILYAFSCFEKQVQYDEALDRYTITLHFANNEREYVLSKLRFLGRRIRVIKSKGLQERMRQTALMALGRYEEG
ncbi:WYL domain-containing protein [Paenibacillus sp. 1P07SE]|uniref:WYL domain-containing protein n=1 Tax=Paenibacillus sp. 1P07SE TaxID=3132209 RepID=UPI0039A590BE